MILANDLGRQVHQATSVIRVIVGYDVIEILDNVPRPLENKWRTTPASVRVS